MHQSEEPFDSWLRQYMYNERLTAAQIAVLLHVSCKMIYEWLRGRGPHHADAIRRLLDSEAGRQRARYLKTLLGEE